ncbi:MAG: methyl-accepting chemotaxis protein [Armatimonadota bacterium]
MAMFQPLFRPATALMDRLPLARKLMLIAAIFLLPIMLLAWRLVADEQEKIGFTQLEIIGGEYVQPTQSLIQHIQQHRVAVYSMKNGVAGFAQIAAQKQNEIAEDIRRLDELNKRYGEQLKATDKWNSLKAEWQNLQQSVQNISAQESFERHTQLIEKALLFNDHLYDASKTAFDPEPDTFYMGYIVQLLPKLAEQTGRTRSLGAGVLARANSGKDQSPQQTALLMQMSAVNEHFEEMEVAAEKIFSASASARDRLQKPFEEAKRRTEEYLALVNDIAKGSSAKTLSVKQYFDIATQAIDAQYELAFATSKTLTDALNARGAQQIRQRNFALTVGIVPALLAFWIFAGFYFSTARTTRMLLQASGRMAQGDTQIDLSGLTSRDEMGQIARAYTDCVVNYLQELAGAAQQIAKGDLTVKVSPRSEKDTLGHSFASMKENLSHMIAQLAQTASYVSSTSQQLSASTEQSGQASTEIARGSEQLAQQASQAAQAMDNLDHAIQTVRQGSQAQREAARQAEEGMKQAANAVEEVARSAQRMSTSAQQSSVIATQGGQSVEQMLETMRNIQQQAQASAQKVQQLDQLGQQIGSIVQTIEQIAEQTNLLALNAAIEAARAGEHGRGFAVVADEVRKLAEQASAATKEIAGLISTVRTRVEETVHAIEVTGEEIANGYARSEQVGEVLSQIVQSAQQVASEVQSVTAVAEQMSASVQQVLATVGTVLHSAEENAHAVETMAVGSEQVSSAIASVASIGEEAAASAQELNASSEEVAAAAQELSRMAQELNQIVSQFRYEQEQGSRSSLRLAA